MLLLERHSPSTRHLPAKADGDEIVHALVKTGDKCNRLVTGSNPVRGVFVFMTVFFYFAHEGIENRDSVDTVRLINP